MHDIVLEDLSNVFNSKAFDKNEFIGKTFMITGATGLVGMMLAKSLIYMNDKMDADIKLILPVRSIAKAEGIFGKLGADSNITFIEGDITNFICNADTIDYVIHCASVTTSKYMVTNPVETIHISYEGTRHVLEIAKEKRVKSFVYVSSMEVYGSVKEEDNPVTEDKLGYIDVHNVRSSYSEGKRICELLCSSYEKEYGIPVRIARLAQTFGAGVPSTDGRVFAQFARCCIEGNDIVLHTEGKSVGNYCYTFDVVEGIFCILTKGVIGEAYNVVNESTAMEIREVAAMVANELCDGKISVQFDIPDSNKFGFAPDTKMRLKADKLTSLGWTPRYDLPSMYRRLMDYWRNN